MLKACLNLNKIVYLVILFLFLSWSCIYESHLSYRYSLSIDYECSPNNCVKCEIYIIFTLGTNVAAGKKLLEESGLLIQFASNLDDAAIKAIASLKK